MTVVYVRWYKSIVQGEVVENNCTGLLAGMVAVRIKVQGMNATALFTPGHVYSSADDVPQKEALIERQVPVAVQSEPLIEGPKTDIPPSDAEIRLQAFKADHWDHEHNHLNIDALEEFYRLWIVVHGGTIMEDAPKPAKTIRQNITPKIPQKPPKPVAKMRCRKCEYLDYDFINDCQEYRPDGEHYCGLHGMARVDPDGPQQNLNRNSGCGFNRRKETVQLSLFD